MTTKLEAHNMLKRVVLQVEFVQTGHPDWVRDFIKKKAMLVEVIEVERNYHVIMQQRFHDAVGVMNGERS